MEGMTDGEEEEQVEVMEGEENWNKQVIDGQRKYLS